MTKEQQIEYLIKNYEKANIEEMATLFNITKGSLKTKADRLRAKGYPIPNRGTKFHEYTKEEIQYIKDNYSTHSIKQLADHIGVKPDALHKMIQKWNKEGITSLPIKNPPADPVGTIKEVMYMGELRMCIKRPSGKWSPIDHKPRHLGNKRKEIGTITSRIHSGEQREAIKTEKGWKILPKTTQTIKTKKKVIVKIKRKNKQIAKPITTQQLIIPNNTNKVAIRLNNKTTLYVSPEKVSETKQKYNIL